MENSIKTESQPVGFSHEMM